MYKRILFLFICLMLTVNASAQIHDRTVTEARSRELLLSYQRKMNALLEDIGLAAMETPDYVVENTDIVTWLKNNRPGVYADNKNFLDSFSRDYLGIEEKEQAPRALLDWFYDFYAKVQAWAEKYARRFVNTWKNS